MNGHFDVLPCMAISFSVNWRQFPSVKKFHWMGVLLFVTLHDDLVSQSTKDGFLVNWTILMNGCFVICYSAWQSVSQLTEDTFLVNKKNLMNINVFFSRQKFHFPVHWKQFPGKSKILLWVFSCTTLHDNQSFCSQKIVSW